MNITIVGAGYVGLVTSASFAKLEHKVVCYDKDVERIRLLKSGVVPLFEPHLEELIQNEKNLSFTDDPAYSTKVSDVIFMCVGTPSQLDGSPDLSYIENAAIEIAKHIEGYKLIVEKSTVPIRTAEWIERTIKLYLHDKKAEFDVASNPEFLREGSGIEDFMNPDRIVIGVNSERAKNILLEIYKNFNCPKVITDVKTAELIKHASNSFLALKISYINMVADFCEKVGVDVEKVAEGMGLDHRIGKDFLKAGIGWGGSCFPKDVKAFIKMGEDALCDFSLLKASLEINEKRIDVLFEKIRNALWVIKGKTIAVLGLSFKPESDDIRESAAVKIVPRLINSGALLKLYDPKGMDNMKKLFSESEQLYYAKDVYDAIEKSHAVLFLTEWEDFKKIDLAKVKDLMLTPIIIDGRNIFVPSYVKNFGFDYISIGR